MNKGIKKNKMVQQQRTKRAQELSLQTIVVAALVLVVLIVIVIIFTGKTGQTAKQIDKTAEPFQSKLCEIPGTPRTCRNNVIGDSCEERGGFVIQDAECPLGGVCCSV